jgi:hypothetical protein
MSFDFYLIQHYMIISLFVLFVIIGALYIFQPNQFIEYHNRRYPKRLHELLVVLIIFTAFDFVLYKTMFSAYLFLLLIGILYII